MLEINRGPRVDLPSITFRFGTSRRMEFEPIPIAPDELIQAIENDTSDPDTNWKLYEQLDSKKLENYLSAITEGNPSDPELNFAEE